MAVKIKERSETPNPDKTVKAIAFGTKECMITIHAVEGVKLAVNVNTKGKHFKHVLSRAEWLTISTAVLKTCFAEPEISSGIKVETPKIILPHA